MFSLSGKNIILTGAAGILGRHFAASLATQGASLALVDVNAEEVASVTAELRKSFSTPIHSYTCDVSSEESVHSVVEQIRKDMGPIHVLVNNAASKGESLKDFFAPYEEYSLRTWRQIMSVNIDGMFLMSKHVGRLMKSDGVAGSIIQTASIYGVVAPDQRIYEGSEYMGVAINTPAVYSASKAAVIGLSSYLSTYWGAFGIRVNTLTPGGVQSGQNSEFSTKYSQRVPLGRMAKPSDLTGALIYLASDESSYLTGQNLIVDGGLTAW